MSETTQVTGAAQATTDATPTSTTPASTPAVAPAASSTPPAVQQTAEPVVAPVVAEPATADATKTEEVKPAKVVPEQYADFKLPDGVEPDGELTTEFKGIAKELGLSQEEAQKVSDVGSKMMQKLATRQQEIGQQLRETWDTASKTDKEFGGDAYKANLQVAEKALNSFGTPELFKLLDESGLRKHPEIIRMFVRAGKAISDDRIIPSGMKMNQGGVDAAKVLYPNN